MDSNFLLALCCTDEAGRNVIQKKAKIGKKQILFLSIRHQCHQSGFRLFLKDDSGFLQEKAVLDKPDHHEKKNPYHQKREEAGCVQQEFVSH
jgi:hypothetical protein